MARRILAVDDRDGIRSFIAQALSTAGFEVETAADGAQAIAALEKAHFDLLITDLKMPRMDGMELLKRAKQKWPTLLVVVLTAHGTIDSAVTAMKHGATDYLTKPLESPDQLRAVVRALLQEESAGQSRHTGFVAASVAMAEVSRLVSKVAPTDTTVLITGESGTGKEVIAREIHRNSPRGSGPFVAINCAAIPHTLIESELFGHEKGAFTGAEELRRGHFESAKGGTLFLDEMGELPLALQAKLLRVLEERMFERVGGTVPVQADARVLAATNRDLLSEVHSGRFREDLYHRICVFPIQLAPLRERKEDIIPLAAHFLQQIGQRMGHTVSLTDGAESTLLAYPWPGNARELRNRLERAAILCTPPSITEEDLQLAIPHKEDAPTGSLREMERRAIEDALARTDGHRRKAAQLLGIGVRTLYNKLKEYGLD